ncbi:integrase [Hyphomicrobium sulfonivorans]|uniref:integrase n=1 Tax=Hyphomicrobium sulfonivorans TaxID=121290 RepID=UPI00156DBE43|nr:integrase [Hyphomicrobium sulfonivorans]MBI1649835.1 integrase [Hyphomicrobium sulfonivorans]NSL71750.1 integrase [Hyphomicrobium sulfonivorans]
MRPIKPQNLQGIWSLVRFPPKRYQHVERRKVVRITTGIRAVDDPRAIRAYDVVQALNAELEAYWESLLNGRPTAPISAENARAHARRLGFAYVPATALAEGSYAELIARIKALEGSGNLKNERAVAGVLGGASKSQIALSNLVEEYKKVIRVELKDHSPDQLRKWANAKIRAVENLQTVIGRDLYIEDLTREHALDFRDWWQDRIIEEGKKIDTANKDFGHISVMLDGVSNSKRLNLDPVFKTLRIKGGNYEQRAPYPIDFVQDRILADGALDAMNPEARRVVYVCAELGLRPVEVVNLTKNSIKLDAEIPHLLIQPEGRVLKTDHSERHVPLVGVALEAMKKQPEGFPTYFDNSSGLSATVNKFFKENGLRPFPKVSLYSLRHTFEDRLTQIEPPEKIQAYAMGHKYDRPKYGSPPELKQLLGWMEKIAFKAPAQV